MHILHYTAECIWALENENCKLHKYETRCIRCEKKISRALSTAGWKTHFGSDCEFIIKRFEVCFKVSVCEVQVIVYLSTCEAKQRNI